MNSETGQKNTTVAYFNVTIGALQQSNIVDLMAAAIMPANSNHNNSTLFVQQYKMGNTLRNVLVSKRL